MLLSFRASGVDEDELRRWRRLTRRSRVPGNVLAWSIAILAITYPIWVSGHSRTSLSGECQGTITADPMSGYEGDPMTHTIVIFPPFDEQMTRVTTNNPLCVTCDATRTRPGRFVRALTFRGHGGTFKVEFIAFDKEGKERCRGYTAEMRVLGPRPQ